MEAEPPPSRQTSALVLGVPTQVACTAFGTHVLVLVTQCGKMGTLVALQPRGGPGPGGEPGVSTRVLLGPDEPLVHVFAKNLVSSVSREAGDRAVLLAVAVKDKSMEAVRALRALIHDCRVW